MVYACYTAAPLCAHSLTQCPDTRAHGIGGYARGAYLGAHGATLHPGPGPWVDLGPGPWVDPGPGPVIHNVGDNLWITLCMTCG
jgi:hypothetical protein